MTSVAARLAVLAACALLFGSPAIAQDEEKNASSPCRQAISCDCDNIEAGLLTRPWQDDCRACEAGIIERCEAAYPPLSAGLAAGGFCENACSVTGPNPTPKAPPPMSEGEVPPEGVYGDGTVYLSCPFERTRRTVTYDGMEGQGCVDDTGLKQGLFFFVDEAANEIVEIMFNNDIETDRTRRPRA